MEYRALKISVEEFVKICNESISMSQAMLKADLHRGTFTKYAKSLGCFNPNQGLKGGKKEHGERIFNMEDWNNDILINVSRSCFKSKIIKYKLLPLKCNKCGLDKWNELLIPLELNHINGMGHENRRTNVEFICPNCHAQTPTYRGRNYVLKHGDRVKKPYNLEQNRKYKKSLSPNKWHPNIKSREIYKKELQENILKKMNLILESNVDFTKPWRLELSKLLKMTPQGVGQFIKRNIPKLWEQVYKHKS